MERNNRIKRLEYWIKAQFGLIAHTRIEHKTNCDWYGNEYGGFYAIPQLIDKSSIIYSFGDGEDISFDRSIIKRHACQVFAFDPTPKSIDWVTGQHTPDLFRFYPFGIGKQTETVKFNLPKNEKHVSGSIFNHDLVSSKKKIDVPLKSFEDILKETGHRKIDLLKMDIEGTEYIVMEGILNAGIEITQILMETHERFFRDGTTKGKQLFNLMKRYGYKVFAISDTYQEISFLKTNPTDV